MPLMYMYMGESKCSQVDGALWIDVYGRGPTQSAWSLSIGNLAKSSVKAKVYTLEVLIGL